jgi:ThiF family
VRVTGPSDVETTTQEWRPTLVAALRPAWRDAASVQFGIDPARAVVVDGIGEQSVRLLLALDGGRSSAEVLAAAAADRLDVPAVAALLADLRAAGVLADTHPQRPAAPPRPSRPPPTADRAPCGAEPGTGGTGPSATGAEPGTGGTGPPGVGGAEPATRGIGPGVSEPGPATGETGPGVTETAPGTAGNGLEVAAQPAAVRPARRSRAGGSRRPRAGRSAAVTGRLAPDRASLALLAAARGGAAGTPDSVLGERAAAAVVIHGAGRVGSTLAALLGAAGVGHVHVVDRGPVRAADLAPGGLPASDLYRSRAAAAADAVRRGAPEVQTGQLAAYRLPNMVVIATTQPVDTDLAAALHCAGLPHLVVGVRETTAVIGPLVLPGQTTCLRCADLHRADRDPAWPLLAAQLTTLRPAAAEPCDVALATLAAALGGLQCLAHIDGEEVACRDGTLELALPSWRVRRRSWPPHRRCGCGAADYTSAVSAARGEWSS